MPVSVPPEELKEISHADAQSKADVGQEEGPDVSVRGSSVGCGAGGSIW